MTTLKGALTDYIYDNYNKGSQGTFLKQNEANLGLAVPLKNDQIKVARRD